MEEQEEQKTEEDAIARSGIASMEMESPETEFSPPDEKNGAQSLNLGNVALALMAAIILIIGIIMIFSKPKKVKSQEAEMTKAGSKYIPDLKLKEQTSVAEEKLNIDEKENSVDEIISTLPPEFRVQPEPSPAPVVSSGSSPASTRPDTRNSNSIRKVEGIAGQNYTAQAYNNQNIVSGIMSGTGYSSGSGYGNGMSREEYVEQMLSKTMNAGAAYGGYGSSNLSEAQQYQTNKEAFFNNGTGNAGKGNFLSYGSLWEGTIISGALETAVNTDNPGLVIARVTENIYSSYDGSLLLIPEGSLLYATYNSSVSYGQNRVQIAWNLLIRPDGYRVELGNMNGVDAQGASGTKGHATKHPFETMKALGLVAVFSIIQTEINNQIDTANSQYMQNAMNDTYMEASKIGNKILDKALDIKPTVTIKQGTVIKLITNTTLELPPVKVNPVTRKYVRTQ